MNAKDLYITSMDSLKIHTKQRMDSFNFFFVLSGLLTNATIICLDKGQANRYFFVAAIVLSLSIMLISFVFYFGDKRISIAIRSMHELLEAIEKSDGFFVDQSITDIFFKNKNEARLMKKHAKMTITKVF